jgi:hypothetical protein
MAESKDLPCRSVTTREILRLCRPALHAFAVESRVGYAQDDKFENPEPRHPSPVFSPFA